MSKITEITQFLESKGVLSRNQLTLKQMTNGTTAGIIYTLLYDDEPRYVLKLDEPRWIESTEAFLSTYASIELLPNVLYTDPKKEWIVYTYIAGKTHFSLGGKILWMNLLIEQLFNQYQKVESDHWGRVNGLKRTTWSDFNEASLDIARTDIGDVLSQEDHQKVEQLVTKLKMNERQDDEKYVLHGDLGVHNFVFEGEQLVGVIDPAPLVGPLIYDFTYAFCSSPDDLTVHMLLSFYDKIAVRFSISKERLLDECIFQLYTRIGVCIRVHPQDLPSYLEAWKEFSRHLPVLS